MRLHAGIVAAEGVSSLRPAGVKSEPRRRISRPLLIHIAPGPDSRVAMCSPLVHEKCTGPADTRRIWPDGAGLLGFGGGPDQA